MKNESVSIRVRVPVGLRASLEKYARERGLTMSSVVRGFIVRGLRECGDEGELDVVERKEEKLRKLERAKEMYYSIGHYWEVRKKVRELAGFMGEVGEWEKDYLVEFIMENIRAIPKGIPERDGILKKFEELIKWVEGL